MDRIILQGSQLTEAIVGDAIMCVHWALGRRVLESMYKKAWSVEPRKASLLVESRKPISVHYDDLFSIL